jgi:hypothetical protein
MRWDSSSIVATAKRFNYYDDRCKKEEEPIWTTTSCTTGWPSWSITTCGSAFSMLKAKFGDSVRSKSDTGQINEALCKVLCHNICVLIHAMYTLNIHPV